MSWQPFDLVRVPFPFTDRQTSKRRPALVLSTLGFQMVLLRRLIDKVCRIV